MISFIALFVPSASIVCFRDKWVVSFALELIVLVNAILGACRLQTVSLRHFQDC